MILWAESMIYGQTGILGQSPRDWENDGEADWLGTQNYVTRHIKRAYER